MFDIADRWILSNFSDELQVWVGKNQVFSSAPIAETYTHAVQD